MEKEPTKKGTVFAERLRRRFEELSITSETAFAKAVGIAQSTFNRYARGETEPVVSDLVAIAAALRCSIEYLAGVSDELKASHYLIDLEAEQMALAKKPIPKGRRWAWPIPDRFEIVSLTQFDKREEAVMGKKRKTKEEP